MGSPMSSTSYPFFTYILRMGDLRIYSLESPGKYRMVSWSGFILEIYSSKDVRPSGSCVEWNLK